MEILLSLIFKLCIWVCVHVCGFLWRPEEATGSPGAGGRGDCELPDVGILSYQAIISRPYKCLEGESRDVLERAGSVSEGTC